MIKPWVTYQNEKDQLQANYEDIARSAHDEYMSIQKSAFSDYAQVCSEDCKSAYADYTQICEKAYAKFVEIETVANRELKEDLEKLFFKYQRYSMECHGSN